jgi:hypothetical protein
MVKGIRRECHLAIEVIKDGVFNVHYGCRKWKENTKKLKINDMLFIRLTTFHSMKDFVIS